MRETHCKLRLERVPIIFGHFFPLSQNFLSIEDSTKTKLDYYNQLISQDFQNSIEKANIYQTLGEIFLYEEKLDSAQKYFSLSENLYNEVIPASITV